MQQSSANSQPDRPTLDNKLVPAHSTITPATPHVRAAGGYREVVSLAFPLVLSMLSQTIMTAVESAFLGHFGTVEQGAAGLAGALLWPLLLSCNWSGIGVQICVAQSIGAQRRADCGAFTWQGMYVSLLAWLFLILAGLGAPLIVQLSAPSPALVVPTVLYLRIELLGSLPGLLNLSLVGFFRGLGDTKTPLMVTLVVELLGALLDVLFIFGVAGFPRLGIAGAALSTVSATTVGTVIYLCLCLRRGRREGFLTQPRIPFDRGTCWRLVRLSWPIGAHGALDMGAWTLFTALIARLGTVEAAAHAIAIRVISLAYMAGYGISVAATTLVGRYLGAQEPVAARRSMRSCLMLTLLLMGSMGCGGAVGSPSGTLRGAVPTFRWPEPQCHGRVARRWTDSLAYAGRAPGELGSVRPECGAGHVALAGRHHWWLGRRVGLCHPAGVGAPVACAAWWLVSR